MNWFRRLLFVLCFFADVKVHAVMVALPRDTSVIEEPANCIVEASVCAMKTRYGAKYEARIGESRVMLASDSIIVRLGAGSFSLIKGQAWVLASGELSLQTEFGEFRFETGEAWAYRTPEKVMVRSLGASVEISSRGRSEKVRIEPGFENFLGSVTREGKASIGIPAAFDLRDQVKRLAAVFPGKKTAFKDAVRDISNHWREAMFWTVSVHREIIDRQVAAADEEKRKRAAAKKRYDDESARLRSLFLERLER